MPFLNRLCRLRPFILAMGLLCLLASVCLAACAPSGTSADDLAYAEAPFTAAIRGTFTRTAADGYTGNPALTGTSLTGVAQPIAATVTVGAPRAGTSLDGEGRDMTLTFTEPPALAGMTVTVTCGTAETSAGTEVSPARTVTLAYPSDYGTVDMTDTSGAFDGLLRFAEALLPVGDVVAVSPTDEDGSRTVTLRTGDGARETVFTFDEEKPLPTRVTVTTAAETLELTVTALP